MEKEISEAGLSSHFAVRIARLRRNCSETDIQAIKDELRLMKIMKDIICRGYENYEDYKNQLDAVDLGYPDMEEAFDLYKAFCNQGLVTYTLDYEKAREKDE